MYLAGGVKWRCLRYLILCIYSRNNQNVSFLANWLRFFFVDCAFLHILRSFSALTYFSTWVTCIFLLLLIIIIRPFIIINISLLTYTYSNLFHNLFFLKKFYSSASDVMWLVCKNKRTSPKFSGWLCLHSFWLLKLYTTLKKNGWSRQLLRDDHIKSWWCGMWCGGVFFLFALFLSCYFYYALNSNRLTWKGSNAALKEHTKL